jgi:hypothetical protein
MNWLASGSLGNGACETLSAAWSAQVSHVVAGSGTSRVHREH